MDSAPPTVPVHDESFYFDDDPMATFLVENHLFKVHRHFFIQGSAIFRDMFLQTGGPGGAVAGEKASDERYIPLPEVTAKEFRMLLRYFYAMTRPISDDKDTVIVHLAFDQEEKLALFSIAHRFVFDHIVDYMSRKIEPKEIPVVDRIRLGDKYNLTDWLSSAYEEILGRIAFQRDMSQEEVDVLGLDRMVKILWAKTFMLDERLKAALETPRDHVDVCNRCRAGCPNWKRGNGWQALRPERLNSTAKVVEMYFLPGSRSPSPSSDEEDSGVEDTSVFNL